MSARRVVVTGASSGIGAATVRLFRAQRLGRGGRRPARGAAARRSPPRPAPTSFAADLTVQDDVDALPRPPRGDRPRPRARQQRRRRARARLGGEVDASTTGCGCSRSTSSRTKRVISALLPLLRGRAPRTTGHADILTVTSIAGHTAYVGGGGYNAAKFAEHALTEVLRLELERRADPGASRSRPGWCATEEFSLVRFGGDQAAPRRRLRGRPRAAHGRRRRARRSWMRSSARGTSTST